MIPNEIFATIGAASSETWKVCILERAIERAGRPGCGVPLREAKATSVFELAEGGSQARLATKGSTATQLRVDASVVTDLDKAESAYGAKAGRQVEGHVHEKGAS